MEAIGGVGGAGSVNAQASRSAFATATRPQKQRPQKQNENPGTLHEALYAGAALDLSRLYLSSALLGSGFVDLCAGVQVVLSPKEAVDSFTRETEKCTVERILDMILEPDANRLVKLLW